MAQIKTTYDAGVGAGGFALDSLADPKDAFRIFDDFLLDTTFHTLDGASTAAEDSDLDLWKLVQLSGNTTFPAISTAGGFAGGTMRFTTHTGADDGAIIYADALWNAPNSKDCAYEVRVSMANVDESDFFFGFSEGLTTSDIISSGAVVAAADGRDRVGWFSDSNTTIGKAQVFCSNGTAGIGGTTTGELDTEFGVDSSDTAAASGAMIRFGITVTGSTVRFFINGELKHQLENASLVPSASVYPVMFMTTNASGAESFDVDYIDVSGKR
jgi:hypothetical protein